MPMVPWRILGFFGRFGRRMHIVAPQTVVVDDDFADADRILDLGGGGEGVIGQLRGKQVTAIDLRQGELDDAPAGPTKVVADARTLPFADRSFDAATAFFFLMYVAAEDRSKVLREAHRVLRRGGTLRIWDAAIPSAGRQNLSVVPVKILLPGRTIRTAYGVPWAGREMSAHGIAELARSAGFSVVSTQEHGRTFCLVLTRPSQDPI
jgi:ubiquinone/menaquinone biosynthesis C-methylase UbiE